MLVLSRKPGQAVVIDGNITLKVLDVEGDRVRIGIEAPRDVPVHREEVYLRVLREAETRSVGGMTQLAYTG